MKANIVLLLALIAPAAALAQNTATVSWFASLTRMDGSTITGPVTFNVFQGASGKEVKVASNIGSNFYSTTAGLVSGTTVCFQISEIETATGVESVPSIEVCKTFPMPAPTPPTGLSIK